MHFENEETSGLTDKDSLIASKVAIRATEIAEQELGWDSKRAAEMAVLGSVHRIGYRSETDPEKAREAGAKFLEEFHYPYAEEVRQCCVLHTSNRTPAQAILNKAVIEVGDGTEIKGAWERVEDIAKEKGEMSDEYREAAILFKENRAIINAYKENKENSQEPDIVQLEVPLPSKFDEFVATEEALLSVLDDDEE